MWPEELMPDPRGGLRLTHYDCRFKFKKTKIKIPVKIKSPDDYREGTRKAKLIDKMVWLVEITIPKDLMNDIKTGSIELEDVEDDFIEINRAYEKDLDKQSVTDENPSEEESYV